METTKDLTQKKDQFGIPNMALANLCKNCGICAYANRKPESTFGKVMTWHREWCPARLSHNKVYGLKGDV